MWRNLLQKWNLRKTRNQQAPLLLQLEREDIDNSFVPSDPKTPESQHGTFIRSSKPNQEQSRIIGGRKLGQEVATGANQIKIQNPRRFWGTDFMDSVDTDEFESHQCQNSASTSRSITSLHVPGSRSLRDPLNSNLGVQVATRFFCKDLNLVRIP